MSFRWRERQKARGKEADLRSSNSAKSFLILGKMTSQLFSRGLQNRVEFFLANLHLDYKSSCAKHINICWTQFYFSKFVTKYSKLNMVLQLETHFSFILPCCESLIWKHFILHRNCVFFKKLLEIKIGQEDHKSGFLKLLFYIGCIDHITKTVTERARITWNNSIWFEF